MQDRVVGVFEDRETAEDALLELRDSGIPDERLTVKRVLQPTHRGFANSDTVHSLIHAPEIREDDHTSEDAGTIILIVEMAEEPDEEQEPVKGDLAHDHQAVTQRLEDLGATETELVPATPGLDL